MDEQLRTEIKQNLETSIRKFFHRKEVKTTHVLDLIFPNERRIRSLIGGLETSLGATIWQPIAKVLPKANGFVVEEKQLLIPKPLPEVLQEEINRLRRIRENPDSWIPMEECVTSLREAAQSVEGENITYTEPPASKGVDLYLSKDGKEYAFDLKTNQINKRTGLDLNQELLEWYAYRFCQDPNASFEARIVFPFNPLKGDWWKRQGTKAYPLEKGKDAWVQDEFWDFCSGQSHTWDELLKILEEIGKEGFGAQFKDVFYPETCADRVNADFPPS